MDSGLEDYRKKTAIKAEPFLTLPLLSGN